jgi:uncharacterized repeat protein (TIGR03837 family)
MLNALSSTPAARKIRCDIFCAVVDNYGDAGVCWRLARQLTEDHGWRVRLYIDDPAPLARLPPDHAQSGSVAVRPGLMNCQPIDRPTWSSKPSPATLPEFYIAAMARREKKPVWLNLEYLSAEAWVASCHRHAFASPASAAGQTFLLSWL